MATDRQLHSVIMGKTVLPFFSVVFHRIFYILAGNEDMLELSKAFEVRPDPTTDCGVCCP